MLFVYSLGVFVVLMVALGFLFKWNDLFFLECSAASLVITLALLAISQHIKLNKNLTKCLETYNPIIPEIVHVQDNSRKFLRYVFKNDTMEIEMKSSDNNFYVPESLLKIEPCNRTIFVKK